ncbi:hypothetical protein HPB52_025217 [Rhipicephalus sanguineus]|uniref:Uncharacterized protein n=1 Tax=Rhipicephalus sanguineus TaxID=34632 RepID=A0A9D4YRP6_RHISA|nr:hypothetical protein HPB52_025217 [Rhipicephalus sanguineus]
MLAQTTDTDAPIAVANTCLKYCLLNTKFVLSRQNFRRQQTAGGSHRGERVDYTRSPLCELSRYLHRVLRALRTPFEVQDVCRILKFSLDNTNFVFNKQYFKRVFGTAMGASVSVVCANIALEDLECAALSSFATRARLF